MATDTNAAPKPIAALYAWRNLRKRDAAYVRELIARTGAFSSWFSSVANPSASTQPFRQGRHLVYLYSEGQDGQSAVAHVAVFDAFTQADGPGGIPCPWPKSAFAEDKTGTQRSHKQNHRYRTWFRFVALHDIPPRELASFRDVQGRELYSGSQLRSALKIVVLQPGDEVFLKIAGTKLPAIDDQSLVERPIEASPESAVANREGVEHPDPEVGRRGEELVERFERNRLMAAGRPELAALVRDRHQEKGLGWDLLSFDVNGTELHIEVKSSAGAWRGEFFLTAAEAKAADSDPAFRFAFVSNVTSIAPSVRFRQPGKDLVREPSVFRVREVPLKP